MEAGEPWVTSVGASTHRGSIFVLGTAINAPAAVAGNYPSPEGFITQPLSESGVITDDVVAANPIDACGTGIDPIDGIALIARGTCFFDDKITNAVAAGASAVIVYTQAGNPKTVMGGDTTQPIPGVMIDNDIGVALLDQLTNGATVNATLDGDTIAADEIFGNTMAIFSARSPYFAEPSFIKPDVTAPGVSVLAGATPEPNNGGEGALFQYLDGTSMASPHVAGIAALLLEAHPAWSPAMIKSALMTTARQNLKQEDGVTRANPFDMGSGHIVPNLAVDPGLVYDYGLLEVQGGTCGTVTPLVTPNECNALANNLGIPVGASNLNLASIGVGGVTGPRTVTRTVTNVGDAASTYTVTVVPPPGFRVDVSPTSLTLAPGDSASYEVRIRNRTSPPGAWRFGSLSWTDGTHVVRSPIAVRAED
jgi:subtilisin family serine protease